MNLDGLLYDELQDALGTVDASSTAHLEESAQRVLMPKLTKIAGEVDHSLGAVLLVGPQEVSTKAREIERFCWKNFNQLSVEATASDFNKLVNEFTGLAQKHAGLA